MPLSQFLRDRLQAYSDNTVPALIITGGSVAIGWAIQTYGPVWGLDPKVAIVLAWLIALVVAIALSLLLKPKSKTTPGLPEGQAPPVGPVISPVEQSVENVGNPKIEVNPTFTQSQTQEVKVERVDPERTVALVITHRPDFLPIEIPSGQSATLLLLNPTHKEAFVTHGNSMPETLYWPRDRSLLPPLELCVRCQLVNYGNTTLLNLAMTFNVKFFSGDTSEEPPVDEHLHRVGIRALYPNVPFIFYIVNQSPYIAMAILPEEAYVEVVGEAKGRPASFIKPTGSIDHLLESMPVAILSESRINWT